MTRYLTVFCLLLSAVCSRAAGEVSIPLSALIGNDAAIKRVISTLRPEDREILRQRMQAIYEQGIRKGARQGDIVNPAASGPPIRPVAKAGSKAVPKSSSASGTKPAASGPPPPPERASDYAKFVTEKSKDGVYTVNFIRNTHYSRSISVTVNGSRMTLKPREKRFLARNSPYSIPVDLKMQSPSFVKTASAG
jgi:hypothetical protein